MSLERLGGRIVRTGDRGSGFTAGSGSSRGGVLA